MDVFIIVGAVILIILFVEKVTKKMLPFNCVPEAFPINYPMEPMLENFCNIMNTIHECNTLVKLHAVFIRIIIFQGCYADSKDEYAELIKRHSDKEIEINSIKM